METHKKDVPSSWVYTTLGEVCSQPQYGYTTKAAGSGDLHLLRTTDITSGRINWETVPYCSVNPEDKEKYLLEEDDIVVSRAGSIGVSYLIKDPRESVFASYLIRFKPFIDRRYFKYFLESPAYWNAISDKRIGIAVPNVNANKLKSISIPVAPLKEQHRIVAEIEALLSKLDNGIESLKTARDQLEVYRLALLKSAFEGRITAQWREKNNGKRECVKQLLKRINQSEANIPKAYPDKLAPLPDGWGYVRLGQIIEEPKYGTAKKCDYKTPGTGVLRIPNIVAGVVDDSDLKFAAFDEDEIEVYGLRLGDILIIRSNGSVSIVGKCAIVSERDEKYLYAGYLIRLRPIHAAVYSSYLHFVLSSHGLRVQIERKAKSTSGVNNINSGELQSLIVPLCGLEEQAAILQKLSQALTTYGQLEKEIEVQMQRAEALRQSILKRAFSGKLVAQDPNDEPASVLLERISGEKTNKEDTKKKIGEKDAA